MEITNEVAPAIETVDNLIEKVKKELGDTSGLRGGREKGHKEEPTMKVEREAIDESTGTAGMFSDV